MTIELEVTREAAGAVWTQVCQVSDLEPERGAAALVDGIQVALFRTLDGSVFAVQQLDPYSGAHVMARGIVGTRADAPTVASPMYKQVFDLRTGECLDAVGNDPLPLATFPVLVVDGAVLLALERPPGTRVA